MKHIKKTIAAVAIGATVALGGCSSPADTASYNLSKAADNFELQRRIVFYNGITGKYILVIEGRCALGNADKEREVTVTCLTGPGEYKKHFLGLSDNVTFFSEQLEAAKVDDFHYRVFFRPESLGPDIDLQTTTEEKPR